MTFYTIMEISKEFNVDITTEKIAVDEDLEDFAGTTAQLLAGQIYTVEQLLYGMMLPSGNDASMCLARWGGKKIRK